MSGVWHILSVRLTCLIWTFCMLLRAFSLTFSLTCLIYEILSYSSSIHCLSVTPDLTFQCPTVFDRFRQSVTGPNGQILPAHIVWLLTQSIGLVRPPLLARSWPTICSCGQLLLISERSSKALWHVLILGRSTRTERCHRAKCTNFHLFNLLDAIICCGVSSRICDVVLGALTCCCRLAFMLDLEASDRRLPIVVFHNVSDRINWLSRLVCVSQSGRPRISILDRTYWGCHRADIFHWISYSLLLLCVLCRQCILTWIRNSLCTQRTALLD